LNAVIRAIVRKGTRHYGDELFGFHDGWRGVVDDNHEMLSIARMQYTLNQGGTVLGTSRYNPFKYDPDARVCSRPSSDTVSMP